MDEYADIDLDDIVFAPVEHATERLALLSLEEAHDLLRLLLAVAHDGGELSAEADRLAHEIAARIPSEN
ncbi:DUF6417 family protein [Streptomyces sp. NPDC005474]|uniref:DUF6417 family protein n=1 Tax=Streptomyces sp. NPDC005474 TaxID=3154878 RepID=UPI003457005A